MEHDGCVGCKYEKESPDSKYCLGCKQNAIDKYTPMTNADKIRNMSDEELAEFLSSINTGRDIGYDYFSAKGGIFIESNKNIIKKVQDWLQSERWE